MAPNIAEIEVRTIGDLQTNTRVFKSEKIYKCFLCAKKFINAEGLKLHHDIHSVATSFSCSNCDKKFPSTDALALHKEINTVRQPLGCSKCCLL